MANQVAKKEDAPLAVSTSDLMEFAGQGVETLGTDDLAIPFLNILQDGSIKPMPSFAFAYNLSTTIETNQHGSWYGYEIGQQRDVNSEEFQLGANFYKAVMAGSIKASVPEPDEESSDDVPF